MEQYANFYVMMIRGSIQSIFHTIIVAILVGNTFSAHYKMHFQGGISIQERFTTYGPTYKPPKQYPHVHLLTLNLVC